MIVFDLRCGAGHVFEAWFGSSGDYEAQRGRGLVSCPVCGDATIEKAVMAPNVAAKGNSRPATLPVVAEPSAPVPSGDTPPPAQMKAMLQALARAQAELIKHSEDVGRRFADEARAIHLGESDARLIHGEATPDEARALRDEGIDVAPLPFPVVRPEQSN
ncbi:MAG: DUF1178 family protein [Sphingomonadaceae bacterium]|nr:DUF1178 family protein [Sphingomonadaceae bacterium]